ncbi:hypothetical protein CRM22_006891 [Opisthorchis felineus]|uniref:Uncharacterized protein n=1 Tax=Opisthorchis felineus TaxID=147828 RepID=A0A4S2LQD7_OPIFE|nr:hypothetical protein CRM22_006891 [Opisthorchis felineus]
MPSIVHWFKAVVLSAGNKIVSYAKQVGNDYVVAGRDTVQSIRQNPGRSTAWCLGLAGLGTTAYLCPSQDDYFRALIHSCVDVWEVPTLLRNPHSAEHVHHRLDLWSRELLRVSHLGLVAVVWRDDRTESSQLYSESCKYSFPANGGGPFTSLVRLLLFDRPDEHGFQRLSNIVEDRLLDCGFMGRWWMLDNSMRDYDINPDEWTSQSIVSPS